MKMKICSYVVFCLAASLSLISGTAIAQQISDNWNTEACSFTDHAGFELQERTRLTSIELWYHWGRRERARSAMRCSTKASQSSAVA